MKKAVVSRSLGLVVFLCLLATSAVSCRRNEARLPVFPVKGQVVFEGKKCSDAVVIFHPSNPDGKMTVLPRARADVEGRFQLATYAKDDGAPEGEYVVVIEWKKADGHPEQGVELLPERYGDAKKTTVKATVRAEATELAPFQLTR